MNCSFTVTVIDGQIPNITQQPVSRTVCAGTNTTFNVTSTNVVGYQWQQWNGTAWVDIPGTNASSYTLNNVTIAQNATSYRVIVIGLCTNTTSAFATLAVNPLPTVSISASQNPLLPNQSALITATANPAAGSYSWFFNGVLQGTTGATYGPVTIDDQGAYRVVFTDPNGCVSTSNTINITAANTPGIWVYPNPNRGVFQVRFFNTANEQVNVIVYSSAGQKVFQKAVTTGGSAYTQMEINISGQPAGVYVVNLVDGSGNIRGSRRIIVNLP
ncbi:MAG: T9SS type A sorting domain-containing protein [Chitinophagaceae bacterium]|nr:T9SS type A sorting domain-containing protein [Chitinophagaceae bacterium]